MFEPGAAATCHFIQLFFADFVQRILLLLVFLLGCAYFFLFLPQTKFAKLGVSTTRTVSAKAHKKGTIPINSTLPDPLLESTEILLLFNIFCNVDHVAAYDTFTPPLSVVDPSWPQWSEGVLGELY